MRDLGQILLGYLWRCIRKPPQPSETLSGVLSRGLPPADELTPGIYWHSTDAHPTNLLLNNVRIGRGRLNSMSATRRAYGGRFITLGDLYPLTGDDAEAIWEQVRAEHYAQKPHRRGALFLFDNRTAAEIASHWRPDSERVVLRVRILRDAQVHRGDLNWFKTPQASWKEAAARYWSGEAHVAGSEVWEYAVDGTVYFPDWCAPPIGGKESRTALTPQVPNSGEMVTCPVCRVEFNALPPNHAIYGSADRSRCVEEQESAILSDCPNIAPLIEAA